MDVIFLFTETKATIFCLLFRLIINKQNLAIRYRTGTELNRSDYDNNNDNSVHNGVKKSNNTFINAVKTKLIQLQMCLKHDVS
jgi:hypothetical protein